MKVVTNNNKRVERVVYIGVCLAAAAISSLRVFLLQVPRGGGVSKQVRQL